VRINSQNIKGSVALVIAIERGNKELTNLLQNIRANMSVNE
jgi:hypothetical protein